MMVAENKGYRQSAPSSSIMHDFVNNLLYSFAAADRPRSGFGIRFSNEAPTISKGTAFIQGPNTTIRIHSGADEERYRATGKRILEAFRLRKQALLAASGRQPASSSSSSHGGAAGPAASQPLFQTSFASDNVFNTQAAANSAQPLHGNAHLCTCCTACVLHRQAVGQAGNVMSDGASGALPTSVAKPSSSLNKDQDVFQRHSKGIARSHTRSCDLIDDVPCIQQAKSPLEDILGGDVGVGINTSDTTNFLNADTFPAASNLTCLPTVQGSPTDDWLMGGVPQPHTPSSPSGLIKASGGGAVPPSLSSSRLQFVQQVLGAPGPATLLRNPLPPQPPGHTYRRSASHTSSSGVPQQASPSSLMADPLVDLLLTQVKTLMQEKRLLQQDLSAMTKENDALHELVGYLAEHQEEDHDDDNRDEDDSCSEESGSEEVQRHGA